MSEASFQSSSIIYDVELRSFRKPSFQLFDCASERTFEEWEKDKIGKIILTDIFVFFPDEQPYCLKYRYYRVLSEAMPTGTSVVKIAAADADLDPKLKFYLTGTGAESFSLENNSGNFIFYSFRSCTYF